MGIRFERLRRVIAEFSKKKDEAEVALPKESLGASHLAQEAIEILQKLYSELGPRPAASKESRKAARTIAGYFDSYSKGSVITSARIYASGVKGIFLSIPVFAGAMFLLLMFNLPGLSFLLFLLWATSLYFYLKRKRSLFNLILPSDEATNVHAVIEPEESVEETIVFSSHHDTASVDKNGNAKAFSSLAKYSVPMLGLCILAILSIVYLIFDITRWNFCLGIAPLPVILISLLGLGLSLFSLYGFFNSNSSYTSGAGDNLSGVVAVIQVMKYFSYKKEKGEGLKHIRLVFTSFDGEECGCQGSDAWFKKSSKLLFNARVFNIDGLYSPDSLVFLSQDGNGLVPLSSALASQLSAIALSMGYKIEVGKLGIMAGETDASSAANAGYKATTLTSMRPEIKTPAHTHEDTPDKVDIEALREAISVAIRFAENEDIGWCDDQNGQDTCFIQEDKKYKLMK